MSIRSRVGITIILSLLTIILIGWASVTIPGSQPSWKGKIVTENGVKVVKNPSEPLYGELILQLEEDLSIGSEKDNNYYFPKGITGLNVDEGGNIYVSDFGNTRVQQFDKTGKFIRTFGRKGQGPGEFQFPAGLQFDIEKNLCVFDSRRIHIFARNGVFKNKISMKTVPNYGFLTAKGTIFGTVQIGFEADDPREAVIKLDREGGSPQTIANFYAEHKASHNSIVWHSYSSRVIISPVDSSSFCYGLSTNYRIFVADGEGKTILILEKEEKPLPITSKEKDLVKKGPIAGEWRSGRPNLREELLFPDHRPYFSRILADGAGRIYIVRFKSILDQTPDTMIDVFSRDGHYLYQTKTSFTPNIIKDGAIYEIRESKETGDYKIIRYKIKNWNQIKVGI